MTAVKLNLNLSGVGKRDEIVELDDSQASNLIEMGHADPVLDAEDDGGASYGHLTVPELKEMIELRNSERDEDRHIDVTGKKAALISALQADDAAALEVAEVE